jgi:hypothetical protein
MLAAAALQLSLSSSAELPHVQAVRPQAMPDSPTPAEGDYSAILHAPIFAPDRAPILLTAQTSGNLAGFNVIGTAIAGPVSTALVRDTTGRTIRIKPDALLQGWRLVSIERTELVFDRDGERRTLPVEAAPMRGPGALGGPAGVAQGPRAAKSDDDDSDDDSSDNKNDDDDDNNDD